MVATTARTSTFPVGNRRTRVAREDSSANMIRKAAADEEVGETAEDM